jgi:hypothetical protein
MSGKGPYDKENGEQKNTLPVDDYGIPILNEVVESDPIADEDSVLLAPERPASGRIGLNLPKHDQLLNSILDQLQVRLHHDLEAIIERATARAVEETIGELKQRLKRELIQSLHQEIDAILRRSLSGRP